MTDAGRSSQREYERRRVKDKEARRRNLPLALVLVFLAPVVVYFAVHFGVGYFNEQFPKSFAEPTNTTVSNTDPISADTANVLALALAGGAGVSFARAAWGRRRTTEAWATGAAGERKTASILARLERRGWIVLHDRRIPRSRANIDHVAIGPTGVFVIETKQYTGKVVVDRSTIRHNGRKRDNIVAEAQKEAAALRQALDDHPAAGVFEVTPVICVHGAAVATSFWGRPVVDGVTVCSGRRLPKVLTRKGALLDATTVQELGRMANEKLRPCVTA